MDNTNWRNKFLVQEEDFNFFKKIPLPNFLLFLFVGTIYSVIEENINCPPTGCTLLPSTIPVFLVFLIIHFGVLKILRTKKFYVGVLIFGFMGWTAEFLLGSHKETLWLSPIVTILMSFWTILTYSVIVIVPLTIFLESKN